jgi:hypothetical protein
MVTLSYELSDTDTTAHGVHDADLASQFTCSSQSLSLSVSLFLRSEIARKPTRRRRRSFFEVGSRSINKFGVKRQAGTQTSMQARTHACTSTINCSFFFPDSHASVSSTSSPPSPPPPPSPLHQIQTHSTPPGAVLPPYLTKSSQLSFDSTITRMRRNTLPSSITTSSSFIPSSVARAQEPNTSSLLLAMLIFGTGILAPKTFEDAVRTFGVSGTVFMACEPGVCGVKLA